MGVMKGQQQAITLVESRMKKENLTFAAVAGRIRRTSGGRLDPDPSLVWRWAKGHVRPSDVYLEALAAALALDVAAVRVDFDQRSARRKRPADRKAAAPGNGDISEPLESGLREVRDQMKRRSLLKAGAALLVAMGTDAVPLAIADEPLRLASVAGRTGVSRGTLEGLRIITEDFIENLWRYTYLPAPWTFLMPHLARVTALLEGPTTYRQRGELCLIGAQISAMLGRVTFENGKASEARLHLSNAFDLAEEIGHKPLLTWIAAEEATMAVYSGNYDVALRLTQAAKGQAHGVNLVSVLSNEARAYGGMGARREAAKAIRLAERAIDRLPPEENNDVAFSFFAIGQSIAYVRCGHAWLFLGESSRAQNVAHDAIEASGLPSIEPPDVRGNKWNRLQADLVRATAQAQQSDPATACALALDVLRHKTNSIHLLASQCNNLWGQLQPYRGHPSVGELVEALHAYRGGAASIESASPTIPPPPRRLPVREQQD
jgi:transcriptional regulator with XRE-family HTH domain